MLNLIDIVAVKSEDWIGIEMDCRLYNNSLDELSCLWGI